MCARSLSLDSAGYAVLCVVLMAGIKWLDERTPEYDPLKETHDRLVRALFLCVNL